VRAPPAKSVMADDAVVVIDGKTKRWHQLTPEERADVRRSIAKARESLARHRIDRGQLQREIQQAMAEAQSNRGEMQRDLAEARADVARAMAEIDAHAIDIRRAGQDPERIKATVRSSLKAVENIDIERITRNALASVDTVQIEASVATAERAIEKAQEELDRIDTLNDPDEGEDDD
jgi:bla regulator protein blaR1